MCVYVVCCWTWANAMAVDQSDWVRRLRISHVFFCGETWAVELDNLCTHKSQVSQRHTKFTKCPNADHYLRPRAQNSQISFFVCVLIHRVTLWQSGPLDHCQNHRISRSFCCPDIATRLWIRLETEQCLRCVNPVNPWKIWTRIHTHVGALGEWLLESLVLSSEYAILFGWKNWRIMDSWESTKVNISSE